jgi:hypothetical protein
MPKRDIATIEAETISKKLVQVLGDAEVEKAARRCGFLRRRREIAPAALLASRNHERLEGQSRRHYAGA